MVVDSDSDASPKVPLKKKVGARVFLAHKQNNNSKTPNRVLIRRYCMIYKKAVMPENKFMSHIADTCFGKSSDQ